MTIEEYNKQLKETVEKLFDLINKGNPGEMADAFIKHLQTEHRFLQSEMIQAFQIILTSYAKTKGTYTDARNAWAVKFARAVAELNVYLEEGEYLGLPK